VIILFKKLTIEEQLRIEKEKNLLLLSKQVDLENAIFELAEIISEIISERTEVVV